MALDEKVSALIGRIYESVENPCEWERALLEVRDLVGAQCLMQSISDLGHASMHQSLAIGDQRRPEGLDEYKAGAFELDMTFRWACKHPHARFCDTEKLFTEDGHASDEFTRWNCSEWIGSKHWIVGYTPPGEDLTFGLSAHASANAGPLQSEKKELFKLLFEHMDRALRLYLRTREFAEEHKAQVLLDRLGCVRALSPGAREILESADGLSLSDGHLYAADSVSTKRLNRSIHAALAALEDGGYGGAVAIPRPSGKRDLLVSVMPYLRSDSVVDAFRPAALLQIVDPQKASSPFARHRWAELFGFTRMESRFVEDLMGRDQNIHHTAEAVGISYATARVHLKHVLEKTGTHSQAQLSRLLTRLE